VAVKITYGAAASSFAKHPALAFENPSVWVSVSQVEQLEENLGEIDGGTA
jgi:hypothetical protein